MRQILDFQCGEGERSKSSGIGRELEFLRDKEDGDGVFLVGGGKEVVK